jgi:WD40 repeat protein
MKLFGTSIPGHVRMSQTLLAESEPNVYFKNVLASPNKDSVAVERSDSKVTILGIEGNMIAQLDLLNTSNCLTWFPHQFNGVGFLAVSSNNRPIVLYNAATGRSICSYIPFNHVEMIDPPLAMDFTFDGAHLVAGSYECIRIFDVQRPGSEHTCVKLSDSRASKEGIKGRISALAVRQDAAYLIAAGSFNNNFGLLDLRAEALIYQSRGRIGSVLQMSFSNDGLKFFTYARQDTKINVWDLRTMSICSTIDRPNANTAQRLHYSYYDDKIAFGDSLGCIYLCNDDGKSLFSSKTHSCSVSGVCLVDDSSVISCNGERTLENHKFSVIKSVFT